MEKKIVYMAELDADVDDIIAVEYLHQKGVLQEVVCDPQPKTDIGRKRKLALEEKGIKVSKKMPPNAKDIFVGGALTEVARYALTHKIDTLVMMNGGFVGCNIVEDPLEKFKGKETIRTFNFNCDVKATDSVLRNPNIGQIILVGKNVCHHMGNTGDFLWMDEQKLLDQYHVKSGKRLHDLLACREGLVYLGLLEEPHYLKYETVYPYHNGLQGNQTRWGSKRLPTGYRSVLAAVDWDCSLLPNPVLKMILNSAYGTGIYDKGSKCVGRNSLGSYLTSKAQ